MAAAAACFSSWQGRLSQVQDGGASLRQMLLEPLQADAIFSLGYRDEDRCDSAERCGVSARLHGLNISHVRMWRMPTARELAERLEALPHWPSILSAFQTRRVDCRRIGSSSSAASPYNCSGLFHSNTIFSPVLGSTFNLHELFGLRQCLDAIATAEATLRDGRKYERVVHTRIEYHWLVAHPPLRLLDPQYVWLPSGEDYGGGFNDRHAVLSRAAAEIYLGKRWDAIISGEIMRIDPQLRGGRVLNALAIQGDYLVRSILGDANVEVRRFASVQALRCCVGPCFTTACYKRVLPTIQGMLYLQSLARQHEMMATSNWTAVPAPLLQAATTLTRAAFDAKGDDSATLVTGKYRDELETAIQHRLVHSLPNARYGLGVTQKELNRTQQWNERHPKSPKSPPVSVVIVAPRAYAELLRPMLMALRIAQYGGSLEGRGRRRKVVVESQYVRWD